MKNTLKRAMAIVAAIALILTLFGGAAYAAYPDFYSQQPIKSRDVVDF